MNRIGDSISMDGVCYEDHVNLIWTKNFFFFSKAKGKYSPMASSHTIRKDFRI